jgi:hypothetical protein
MPTATAGYRDDEADETAVAAAPAVTTVGDKAFVLKNGVWTDTTFDPDLMAATPLPFPSDLFLEFLAERPETGKYFALGPRVIVVIDGVAYETVEGDPADLSEPEPLPEPAQSDAAPDQPAPAATAVTSPPPADATDLYTTLTAGAVEGVAPLEVNFTGELVGGPDDNRDYYCVESSFDFGDGISQSSVPGCVEWQEGAEIQRRFTANYVYEKPGEYQATFRLGDVESAPVTIVVRAGSVEPVEEEAASAQAAPGQDELTGGGSSGATSPSCLLGLLALPLVGVVVRYRPV